MNHKHNSTRKADSSREAESKVNLFMAEMQQREVDIERDLLLLQLAKRLKLDEDSRFQYFIDHCRKYSTRIAEEKPETSVEHYERRFRDLAVELDAEDSTHPQIAALSSIAGMVHTLIHDGRTQDLIECIAQAFPEYYSMENTEVK